MASTIPLKLTVGKLRRNYYGTLNELFENIRKRIRAYVSSDTVMTGKSGLPIPSSDVGLWYNTIGHNFWYWEPLKGEYLPLKQQDQYTASGKSFLMSLNTVDFQSVGAHSYTVQNATGTVATLLDAFVPPATFISTGGSVTLDWNVSRSFIKKLIANTTIAFSNTSPKHIVIAIENLGTAYTVTWPTVKWAATDSHVAPTGAAGVSALGLFHFVKINSTIYGWLKDQTPAVPQAVIPIGGPDSVPSTYHTPAITHSKYPY